MMLRLLTQVLLVTSLSSVAFAQHRSSSCCEYPEREPPRLMTQEAQRSVRPGPKTHLAIGALGGGAVALLLNEIIEGDSQAILPVGVILAVLSGMVAGGVIGWIVYKVRQ